MNTVLTLIHLAGGSNGEQNSREDVYQQIWPVPSVAARTAGGKSEHSTAAAPAAAAASPTSPMPAYTVAVGAL